MSLANSQQTPTPQILLTASHHFSWHFTADSFASFFTGKISKLCPSLTSHPATSSPHSPSPLATPPNFSVFTPAPESEVYKILSNCPKKQSESDPIPTWLLKECSSFLVPTITNIVNLSLISGQFHPTLEESIISPLLKKPTLDKEELSNYGQSLICLSFPK